MVAAYSVDLRQKVIASYKTGNISLLQVANNFGISLSSVKRYIKLDREKKDLSPNKGNKGRPGKIDEVGYKTIRKLIEVNPTITLGDLSESYYRKRKVLVGKSVLSRACLKLKLNRKKLSNYAAERERDDIKKNAKTTLRR